MINIFNEAKKKYIKESHDDENRDLLEKVKFVDHIGPLTGKKVLVIAFFGLLGIGALATGVLAHYQKISLPPIGMHSAVWAGAAVTFADGVVFLFLRAKEKEARAHLRDSIFGRPEYGKSLLNKKLQEMALWTAEEILMDSCLSASKKQEWNHSNTAIDLQETTRTTIFVAYFAGHQGTKNVVFEAHFFDNAKTRDDWLDKCADDWSKKFSKKKYINIE